MDTITVSRTVPTRLLLTCGVVAGPLYAVVVAAQAVSRDGFDPSRHAASMLAVGDHGWIQIVNFLVAGALVVAAAIGLGRSTASRWTPRLLGIFGAGTIGAGLFVPDPAMGFPAGTPDGQPVAMSWHGTAHFAVGGVGFLALIACCLLSARRFAVAGQRGWAVFSGLTGVLFFAAFAGIASGSAGEGVTIGFYLAMALAWAWISAVSFKASRDRGSRAARQAG